MTDEHPSDDAPPPAPTPSGDEPPPAPVTTEDRPFPHDPGAPPPAGAGAFRARGASPSSEPGAVAPPPPPEPPGSTSERRGWMPVFVGALVGALVGAGVATGVVVALDDDPAAVATREARQNSSVINVADDVQSILAKIEPAVVSVRTRSLDLNVFLEPVPSEGAGTGFVIDAEGVIVTNNHVIANAQRIEVVLPNGDTEDATVVGRDPDHDIAVLQIDRDGLPTAALGSSGELAVGDDVIAIGNALALGGGPSVTRGIVSAKDRTLAAPGGVQLESLIQTDAAINPGNSGGPLVNAAGEVVGINTAIVQGAENIGFAISIDAVKPIIEDLRSGEPVSRPFLGVQTITLDEGVARQFNLDIEAGALVLEVVAGSGAEAAGIQRGDVIIEIAGDEVTTSQDVVDRVRGRDAGEEIEITFVRGEDRRTVTATLGERTVPN